MRFRPWRALDAVDRRLLRLLTRRERRSLERLLTRLTHGANRSLLWLVLAEIMAVAGGRAGRRAALHGAVAIGLSSAFVNGPLKLVARRQRPDPRLHDRPPPLRAPASFSFPSGHAASAFAFTVGAGFEEPRLIPLLLPLAAGVAYSRVHLRVHYPFDVLAGAAIGAGAAVAAGGLLRMGREWRDSHAEAQPSERPQSREVMLVVNRRAGRAGGLAAGLSAIGDSGLTVVERLEVDELPKLSEILEERGFPPPMVVAAGGDGTVGALANLLAGTGVVLGILPLGTSNDFARSLGIPMRPKHAARLLARGRVLAVDAGRLNRDGIEARTFVHAATAGLNVNFARLATRADLRRRLGRFSYAVAAMGAFRRRAPFSCTIEHGGGVERLRLIQLSIINAPVFGGILDLQMPGVDPSDAALDVLLVEDLPLRRFLRSLFYPVLGVRRRIRGIRALKVRRLAVSAEPSIEVSLDGEVSGQLPGTFEVLPRVLRVVVPAVGLPRAPGGEAGSRPSTA